MAAQEHAGRLLERTSSQRLKHKPEGFIRDATLIFGNGARELEDPAAGE
jgi:hypothetical protein